MDFLKCATASLTACHIIGLCLWKHTPLALALLWVSSCWSGSVQPTPFLSRELSPTTSASALSSLVLSHHLQLPKLMWKQWLLTPWSSLTEAPKNILAQCFCLCKMSVPLDKCFYLILTYHLGDNLKCFTICKSAKPLWAWISWNTNIYWVLSAFKTQWHVHCPCSINICCDMVSLKPKLNFLPLWEFGQIPMKCFDSLTWKLPDDNVGFILINFISP